MAKVIYDAITAAGEACAVALLANDQKAFAKAEADKAAEHLKGLLKSKKIDSDVFADAVGRATGNISANRQAFEKSGILKLENSDNPFTREVKSALLRLQEQAANDIENASKAPV